MVTSKEQNLLNMSTHLHKFHKIETPDMNVISRERVLGSDE